MPTTPEQNDLPFVENEVENIKNLLSEGIHRYYSHAESYKERGTSLNFLNILSFTLHVMDIPQMILLRAVSFSRTGKYASHSFGSHIIEY